MAQVQYNEFWGTVQPVRRAAAVPRGGCCAEDAAAVIRLGRLGHGGALGHAQCW